MNTGKWVLSAAVVCVLVSAIAVSCGSDQSETVERREAVEQNDDQTAHGAANILTEDDLGEFPRGSPARALLDWVQAVQFRDYEQVLELTTPRERRRAGPDRLHRATELVGPSFGKPKVSRTIMSGSTARVRALVLSFTPGKKAPALSLPNTFKLEKTSGGWRLDDTTILLQSARELSKAAEVP